jgi:hypothetical protein
MMSMKIFRLLAEEGSMTARMLVLSIVSVFLFTTSGYASECNGGGRYDENNDGTVTDCTTGLIWLKNANCTDFSGGIDNSLGMLSWTDAVKWAAGLGSTLCGLSEFPEGNTGTLSNNEAWRLPTKTEWMAMVEYARRHNYLNPSNLYVPALTDAAGTGPWTAVDGIGQGGNTFNYVASFYYWTGTVYTVSPDQAWGLNLNDGSVLPGPKSDLLRVWPVRGGRVGSFGSLHIQ